MDFENLNPVPLVQVKKKYANFTIREIGGEAEMKIEREKQAAKEALYGLRLGHREDRILAFEQLTGQKLNTPTVHTTSWEEKLAFAADERERLARAEANVVEHPPWEPILEPKQTILQQVLGFFKSIFSF